jgi:hypothetical protein
MLREVAASAGKEPFILLGSFGGRGSGAYAVLTEGSAAAKAPLREARVAGGSEDVLGREVYRPTGRACGGSGSVVLLNQRFTVLAMVGQGGGDARGWSGDSGGDGSEYGRGGGNRGGEAGDGGRGPGVGRKEGEGAHSSGSGVTSWPAGGPVVVTLRICDTGFT